MQCITPQKPPQTQRTSGAISLHFISSTAMIFFQFELSVQMESSSGQRLSLVFLYSQAQWTLIFCIPGL